MFKPDQCHRQRPGQRVPADGHRVAGRDREAPEVLGGRREQPGGERRLRS